MNFPEWQALRRVNVPCQFRWALRESIRPGTAWCVLVSPMTFPAFFIGGMLRDYYACVTISRCRELIRIASKLVK